MNDQTFGWSSVITLCMTLGWSYVITLGIARRQCSTSLACGLRSPRCRFCPPLCLTTPVIIGFRCTIFFLFQFFLYSPFFFVLPTHTEKSLWPALSLLSPPNGSWLRQWKRMEHSCEHPVSGISARISQTHSKCPQQWQSLCYFLNLESQYAGGR